MIAVETALTGARRSYYELRNQIVELKTKGQSLAQDAEQSSRLITDMEARHAAALHAAHEITRKHEAQITALVAENTEIRRRYDELNANSTQQLHARDLEAYRLQTVVKQHEAQAGALASELATTRKSLEETQKDRERRLQEIAFKHQQLSQELAIERMKLQSASARLTEVLERNRELESDKIRTDATIARANDNDGQTDRLRQALQEQRSEIQRLRSLNESLAAMIRGEREKARARAPEPDPDQLGSGLPSVSPGEC